MFSTRPIVDADHPARRVLWDGYNAFYGRSGATALPEDVTRTTWQRFFDEREPVHALIVEAGDGGCIARGYDRLAQLSGFIVYRKAIP